MGFINEIKNTVKNIFDADDVIYDDDEFIENDNSKENLTSLFANKRKPLERLKSNDMSQLPSFSAQNHDFNLMQNAKNNKKSNGKMQIYVPKTYEEGFNIIKDVKSGVTAIVNVELASPQIAEKVIDLITGAIYALDGEGKKSGEKQYIFSLSTETVGAFDYMPINGNPVNNPMPQYGYQNQAPFNFSDMNANMQQQQIFNPPFMGGNQQNSFANMTNQMPNAKHTQNNVDMNSFYVPPQSQF